MQITAKSHTRVIGTSSKKVVGQAEQPAMKSDVESPNFDRTDLLRRDGESLSVGSDFEHYEGGVEWFHGNLSRASELREKFLELDGSDLDTDDREGAVVIPGSYNEVMNQKEEGISGTLLPDGQFAVAVGQPQDERADVKYLIADFGQEAPVVSTYEKSALQYMKYVEREQLDLEGILHHTRFSPTDAWFDTQSAFFHPEKKDEIFLFKSSRS